MKRQTPQSQDANLINASDAAKVLGISRGQIERLQIQGKLQAVPTVYALYYFDRSAVEALKDQ